MEIAEQFVLESTFINEEETEQVTPRSQSSNFLISSINCSGLSQDTRKLSVKEIQREFMFQNRSQIRKVRDCTNEVKSTCVNVSVNCNISTETSETAVQTVAKSLYGHEFYLTREKAIEKDPSLSSYKEKQLPVRLSKRQKKEQMPVPTS